MDKMTNFESKLFSSFNIGGIKPERITLSYRDNFRIINDRLKDLLGERADWKLNLDKYYSSEEYLSSCRIVSNVDDIPELSLNDIQKMISADEQYKNKANRLLSLDKIISNNSVSNEKYLEAIYEATAIIGLFEGDTCPLFDWISDRKGIKLSDLPLIINNDPRIRTYPILSIIINSISSLFVSGNLYSFTGVDTVMSQPKTKYYYRGENAFYNSSKAGYFRSTRDQSAISELIDLLRSSEAGYFLDNFDAVKYWNKCSVNYLAYSNYRLLIDGYKELIEKAYDVDKKELELDFSKLTYREIYEEDKKYYFDSESYIMNNVKPIENEKAKTLVHNMYKRKKIIGE